MGPVQTAVRKAFQPPASLRTPARQAPFVLQDFKSGGLVLLLGKKRAYTALSWECLEGVAGYLRGRGWVPIGSRYEIDADPGTLDAYLKGCLKRATAGWVAAVLEGAGVVDYEGSPQPGSTSAWVLDVSMARRICGCAVQLLTTEAGQPGPMSSGSWSLSKPAPSSTFMVTSTALSR